MWLVDNSNGGTVYAWNSGTFPPIQQFQFNNQIGVTPMPIPLQNVPLLLNFGGANPSISIEWYITSTNNFTGSLGGDWQQLTQTVQWGASTSGYTLYMPEVSPSGSTLTAQCFLYQLQVANAAGQPGLYTASMTLYPGTVI